MVEAGKNGHPDGRVGAAESVELSSDLVRTLVHELRNPLAPIRNAAELLRTLCADPRQLQSVDIISRQVSSLTRALDDLTDALSGAQNHLLLGKQTVDLSQIVEPALQAIRPIVDGQRQSLLVSLPNEPVQMHCDPQRLTQVIQTLLENSTRHTPAGGSIILRVSRNAGQLLVEVSDDGAGIAPDRLRALFNVFTRRSASTDVSGSAGLNLAISRNIIEMHGGSIEAFSEGAGRGSRFVFHLPLSDDAGETASLQSAERPGARKVIIIDDQEDSMSGVRDVLAAAGHSVLAASTGELGIALAETFRPDAVIIDIGLPGMDGFEVAKRLHENSATADALLIAVSGFSLKQFRDLSAYSVFRHYLLKPASPQTILTLVDSVLDRSRESRGRKP
jgi:CheY-like chemotaxis protein